MSQPKGYVDSDYLKVVAEKVHQLKQKSYTYMRVQPGDTVLDVGCGPGTDTIPLAQLVGANGRVMGVDYDPDMVAEANQRAAKAGVGATVKHERADAASMPFETGFFDSCRSERLFQHLHNPAHALAEMARVVKPGGWVVVVDTDWGTASTDTSEIDIERRFNRVRAERFFNNGYSGRQLFRLFKMQNMVDLEFEVFPQVVTNYAFARQVGLVDEVEKEALNTGIISTEELLKIQMSLEQADAEGYFFAVICIILMAGRKI